MEVVYFFCESASIRVPYLWYSERLNRLLKANGGVRDYQLRKFTFKSDINVEKISHSFSGIICVWVEENSSIKVFGFWEGARKGEVIDIQNDTAPSATIRNDDNLDEGIPNVSISENLNEVAFPKTEVLEKPQVAKIDFSSLGPLPLPEKFPEHWRVILETELRARKYSPKTMRCYIYYNRLICRILQKAPEDIQPEEITQFLANVEKDRDYSASSLNLAISAIKFFYREVLKREEIGDQHRPRHDKKLPMVLSKTEIGEMLRRESNPKHRLLLMLVYSSGLRVSEVVSLRKEHIDLSRKVIFIMLGKGRKDRCTLLSEKAANFLTEYFEFFNIQTWLFPGQPATQHLSIRSAQQIFDKAIRRAEINKKISIHGLRHTFATHLLETGTDIRYIQSLLGHATLRTTERYTHIARRNILSIQSPLDTIP